MEEIKFKTANEMINWLMNNEGKQLADNYGRKWKYENYSFYFKDIGDNDEYEETIKCLHLFGTLIGIIERE